MSNAFEDLSNAMAGAVEKAGKSTVLVDARRRFPASGIAYTADLILTADHVAERDEEIKVILFDGTQASATVAGRDPGSAAPKCRANSPVTRSRWAAPLPSAHR